MPKGRKAAKIGKKDKRAPRFRPGKEKREAPLNKEETPVKKEESPEE
ncbi:MAG: hypothetical protein LUQ65_14405 [Candidatus Helarchaeota archaeon]|nr:hypothetical protein [Candidatus Helarchaeota archaeon]